MTIAASHNAPFVGYLVGIAALIGTASFPATTNAEGVRYPGAMCRQHAGPGAFLYYSSLVAPGLPAKSLPQHNASCPPPQAGGCPPCQDVPACRNDTAFNARVDCPIPKSFPDLGIDDVTVDVIDRHDNLNVECVLVSALWDPGANDFKEKNVQRTSSGSGNSIQPLKFSPMTAVGSASHWYVSCSLPANSAVVSYYVNERSALSIPPKLTPTPD